MTWEWLMVGLIAVVLCVAMLWRSRSASERAWRAIRTEVESRYELLKDSVESLEPYQNLPPAAKLRLASADVFVEKAQYRLSVRAKLLLLGGIATGLCCIALLVSAAIAIYQSNPQTLTAGMPLDGFVLALIFMRALSFGGFVLGAVYFLGSLSRAFFHEATVLYNRRHALRFGRLAIYLEDGSPNRDALERIFRWNDDFISAFKEIQTEAMREVGLAKLANLPPEALKSLAEVTANLRDAAQGKEKKK